MGKRTRDASRSHAGCKAAPPPRALQSRAAAAGHTLASILLRARESAALSAELGSGRLASLALEHGSVALVGHGMLNTLLVFALRRGGWTGSGEPRAYWGLVALRRTL